MFNESVIRKTHQWWKLLVGAAALIVGSVAPLFEASGMSWTAGTVVAVVGYGFVLVAVRCPSCEQRWFWRAILYSEIYSPLFTKAACPSCKHDFGQDAIQG